jgi:hypothetical protein
MQPALFVGRVSEKIDVLTASFQRGDVAATVVDRTNLRMTRVARQAPARRV